MESKGKATIGAGTPQQRELDIIEFVQAEFKDHRLISVCELEDDSLTVAVENPQSSGRATHQAMRLGKESFVGLFFSMYLYMEGKGLDISTLLTESLSDKDIDFSYSSGITPPSHKD